MSTKCIYAVSNLSGEPTCSLKLCDGDLAQCCETCKEYTGPDRGLGDTVKRATNALGLKTCGGCQRRREALNRWSKGRGNNQEGSNS
jgi:hypothetical protein